MLPLLMVLGACPQPPMEYTFNSIVEGLFAENLVPSGDVLDVGAHDGAWACMYACFQPQRTIRAVDPSSHLLHSRKCAHANLHKHVAAMSNVTGTVANKRPNGYAKLESAANGDTAMETIDSLFLRAWDAHLGFAHLDVEGFEEQVVRGGEAVLRRDRPIVTYEVHASRPSATSMLLLMEQLAYKSYIVHESCGMSRDCRNVLAFPRERMASLSGSATLDLAVRGQQLSAVNSTNVWSDRRASSWYDAKHFWRVR